MAARPEVCAKRTGTPRDGAARGRSRRCLKLGHACWVLIGSSYGPDHMPEWDDAAEARFRDWYGTRNQQADRLDLAVVDNASGQCVGEVVLNDWNEANRSCGFRTVLGPRGRNRGLGTESAGTRKSS